MNSWIQYVKDFAAKNGMSYRDALRSPKCKAGYYKKGSGVGSSSKIGTEFNNILTNEASVKVTPRPSAPPKSKVTLQQLNSRNKMMGYNLKFKPTGKGISSGRKIIYGGALLSQIENTFWNTPDGIQLRSFFLRKLQEQGQHQGGVLTLVMDEVRQYFNNLTGEGDPDITFNDFLFKAKEVVYEWVAQPEPA